MESLKCGCEIPEPEDTILYRCVHANVVVFDA